MNWRPLRVSSGTPGSATSSGVPPRPRTRPRLLIAIAAVAAVVGALFVATQRDGGDGGDCGSACSAPTTVIGQSALIGQEGGRMVIPATDPNGAGITVDVPMGATSTDVGTALIAMPQRFADVPALSKSEPFVWPGLADYALDNGDTLLHPVFGALELASLIEFTGPMIVFGPRGIEFDEPATVEVPLSLVDLPAGTVPVVLLGDEHKWEVIDRVTIDEAKRVLRYEVRRSGWNLIGRIPAYMVSNPTASPTIDQYHHAFETLSAGPAQGVSDGVLRAVLCADVASFDAAAVPDASTIFDYLDAETTRISKAPAGAATRIADTLRAHFEASRAAGNQTPHDITFDQLLTQAMKETSGDPFQALVLAHDVLRDNRNSPSVQAVMVNVRGDGGDEAGARYHLLGTAVYAFAYEYFRATHQAELFWPPGATTVASLKEASVSSGIRTDTVGDAVDHLGARLGRDLYREYAAIAAGDRSLYADLVCATAPTASTSTTTTVDIGAA